MAFYVENKQDNLVPDGEYVAKITSIKLTRDGENVVFRCAIQTEGFDNIVVPGFCGAHWKPSTRTTQNLRQWCINLGANVVKGHENEIDLEGFIGKECRIIVQSYKSKAGEDKCKVSNILPLQKSPRQVTAVPVRQGLHIGGSPAQAQQVPVAQVQATQAMPVEQPQQAAIPQPVADTQSDSDDLW